MKTYLLISAILLTGIQLYSQKAERLDTIFANEHKNVALFFPQPISQGITGASHFVFSHNRERQQYFGLLQAKPGTESNLLVIDAGGSVYSYILKYRKDLSRLNYFIQGTERIGNAKPDRPGPAKKVEPKRNQFDRETHYRNFCFYLLNKKERIGRVKKRNQGIILSVENIVFLSICIFSNVWNRIKEISIPCAKMIFKNAIKTYIREIRNRSRRYDGYLSNENLSIVFFIYRANIILFFYSI